MKTHLGANCCKLGMRHEAASRERRKQMIGGKEVILDDNQGRGQNKE